MISVQSQQWDLLSRATSEPSHLSRNWHIPLSLAGPLSKLARQVLSQINISSSLWGALYVVTVKNMGAYIFYCRDMAENRDEWQHQMSLRNSLDFVLFIYKYTFPKEAKVCITNKTKDYDKQITIGNSAKKFFFKWAWMEGAWAMTVAASADIMPHKAPTSYTCKAVLIYNL